jgi:hypothetical protein
VISCISGDLLFLSISASLVARVSCRYHHIHRFLSPHSSLYIHIRTSNLLNFLIIGIRGTQFVSYIYRVPVSIFVPWIWPLRREPCTISTNVCIQAHITWMDNSHSVSSVVIFVTCLSSSTSFTYRFLISIPLVKRMCLVLGRQLW